MDLPAWKKNDTYNANTNIRKQIYATYFVYGQLFYFTEGKWKAYYVID